MTKHTVQKGELTDLCRRYVTVTERPNTIKS